MFPVRSNEAFKQKEEKLTVYCELWPGQTEAGQI